MKKGVFLKKIIAGFCLILWAVPYFVYAQNPSPDLDSLTIDLWPDYDRASVLVLMTGTLPNDTPLPATVIIPLPANAELQAVARVTSDDVLVDDLDFSPPLGSVGPGEIRLVTPDLRFRLEYYLPYTRSGDERSFSLEWQADFAVAKLDMAVQEPAGAQNFVVEPTAVSTSPSPQNGLLYHMLPIQATTAGQKVVVNGRYTLPGNTLAIDAPPSQQVSTPASSTISVSEDGPNNWPLLLAGFGGFLIVIAVVWQIALYRTTQKLRTTATASSGKPTPATNKTAVRFCHACGQPRQAGDRFCRKCGTTLKQ